MPEIQTPYCLAMVLANAVYRDPVSNVIHWTKRQTFVPMLAA